MDIKPIHQRKLFSSVIIILCFSVVTLALMIGCKTNPYDCQNTPEEYLGLEESVYYIYVLWRADGQSIELFQKTVFDVILPQIKDRVELLSIMVADQNIISPSLIKRKRDDGSQMSAIISVFTENPETAEELVDIIKPEVHFMAGYKTLQAIPRDYNKNWEDGQASPGVKQVTLLQKRTDLEYDEFKDYWFCSHTPLALDINPIWRYERNEVLNAITPDAPPYNGIVGLHFEFENDITNLNRFFGGNFLVNSILIGIDVFNFIDMNEIEVTAMTEYIIRS